MRDDCHQFKAIIMNDLILKLLDSFDYFLKN